jgi:hypothetical protein
MRPDFLVVPGITIVRMFGSILAQLAVLLAVSKGNGFSPAAHQNRECFSSRLMLLINFTRTR